MLRRVGAILLTVAIGAGCGGDREARTYFESLELATPEATARTFVDAFEQDDYMTVWMVLHPQAQFAFQQQWNLMQWDPLIDTSAMDPLANVPEAFDLSLMETSDAWWFFDQLMWAADRQNALLIDLGGGVELGSPTTLQAGQVDIPATVPGVGGQVIIRLEEHSGRYRVLQVVLPGGSTGQIPWSVP